MSIIVENYVKCVFDVVLGGLLDLISIKKILDHTISKIGSNSIYIIYLRYLTYMFGIVCKIFLISVKC